MKLRRRSKVNLWFAESRDRYDLKRQQYLADKAWLTTKEGEEFLAEWRASLEGRSERVRQLLENLEPISKAFKDTYPDNAPPAPLKRI
jgi:hypothetical protein